MKGTVLDLIVIGIMLTATGIFLIFTSQILNDVESTINAHPLSTNSSRNLNTTYIDKVQEGFDVFNGSIVFLLLGFGIAAIIGAFKIESHPAFFIFSFIIWIFAIFLSTIFSNLIYAVQQSSQLSAGTAQFSLWIQVLLNLPLILGVMGAIITIVLLGKASGRL